MAQVGLFQGCHAYLTTPLLGCRTKKTVPPLLVVGKQRDPMFNAKLAAAMLKAPAVFIAHL
jgi:hypothetical protein